MLFVCLEIGAPPAVYTVVNEISEYERVLHGLVITSRPNRPHGKNLFRIG
jgi:hypothetical protein